MVPSVQNLKNDQRDKPRPSVFLQTNLTCMPTCEGAEYMAQLINMLAIDNKR